MRKRKSIPGEGTTQRQHVQRHGDIKNSTQVPYGEGTRGLSGVVEDRET